MPYLDLIQCIDESIAAEAAQASGRGVGSANFQDLPEWKKSILGGPKASYGKKEKRSIMEQRQVWSLENASSCIQLLCLIL